VTCDHIQSDYIQSDKSVYDHIKVSLHILLYFNYFLLKLFNMWLLYATFLNILNNDRVNDLYVFFT